MSRFNTSDFVRGASRSSSLEERPDKHPDKHPEQYSESWKDERSDHSDQQLEQDFENWEDDRPENWPENWEDLLLKYALGELSPEETRTFRQLIIHYPELEPRARAAVTSLESLPLPLVDASAELFVTNTEAGTEASTEAGAETGTEPSEEPSMRPMQTLLPAVSLSAPLPWQFRMLLPDTESAQTAKVSTCDQLGSSLSSNQAASSQVSTSGQASVARSKMPEASQASTASRSSAASQATVTRKISYQHIDKIPVCPLPRRDRTRFRQVSLSDKKTWKNATAVAAAIALSAAAIAGLNSYWLRQQLQTTTTEKDQAQAVAQARTRELLEQNALQNQNQALLQALRQPDSRLYDMRPADKMFAGAFGRLVVVPKTAEATFVVSGLPAIAASQVYRLWAIAPTSTQPFYCGELSAVPISTEVWTLPTAQCGQPLQKIFITLEAGDKAAAPTGNVVLSGD